jgi:2'-hydroxyisoflavone reductase
MAACAAATGAAPTSIYVGDDWLAGQGVEPWTEVPLWVPRAEAPSLFTHHSAAAEAAGLTWRPLAETVHDTWLWMQALPEGWHPSERTPGLAADRERELLSAWRGR